LFFSGNLLDALDGDRADNSWNRALAHLFRRRASRLQKSFCRRGHRMLCRESFLRSMARTISATCCRVFPLPKTTSAKLGAARDDDRLWQSRIFKWQMLQALDGFVRSKVASLHGFQNFQQFV